MTVEEQAAAAPRFALGLGLTNECNLACAFCYRDPDRTDRLDLAQVRRVMERLPVRSVNLGTGENGMHPDFREMLAWFRSQPVKLTITSNGHSVEVLEDAELRSFADIEFSLDYPTREEQDAQRGAGNWDLIQRQARRCRDLGIGVTIIAVMMRSNYDRLPQVARIAKTFDAPLRVNVYQAVRSDRFALTYEEYWAGFARLFAETDAIAVGEPLVRAMAGCPRAGRLRLGDRSGDAARHRPALRVLAWRRRPLDLCSTQDRRSPGHRPSSPRAPCRGLRALRAPRHLRRRLRRPSTADGGAGQPGSVLPGHPWRSAAFGGAHGGTRDLPKLESACRPS
jgi:MoaA/NifB/PqqE/SkfB family radical SAM enzyme